MIKIPSFEMMIRSLITQVEGRDVTMEMAMARFEDLRADRNPSIIG